jgi:hypothetical protein
VGLDVVGFVVGLDVVGFVVGLDVVDVGGLHCLLRPLVWQDKPSVK